MSAEEVKPEKAAAPEGSVEQPTPEVQANTAASERSVAEVHETEQQKKQQATFDACVATDLPKLPKDQNLLNALTSGALDRKLGGDCAATERVADLHRELTPLNDNQQIKVEIGPDGARIESRFENGKLLTQRSVLGDASTLRMYDDKGNLTTVTEAGVGDKKVQTWTFPDGDSLRIQADGTFNGEINGIAVSGRGKADIEAYFKLALADQSFKPDVNRDSLATDLYGTSMLTNSDTRTSAIVQKSGDLNILSPDSSGVMHRNVVKFEGNVMTLYGPNGAVTKVEVPENQEGVYTFVHNGISYTARDGKFEGMKFSSGNLDRTVTKGPNGWHNEAVERPVSASGLLGPENRVVTTFNDKGELQSQILDGDRPVQTTVITGDVRTTYRGDGSDRSPENVLMRATNNSLETPEITRRGSMAYDATGVYSDKDHFGPGVYYDIVSGKNLTNTQLLQFASFAAAMSSQVSSFQNYFEGVALGANGELPSVDGKIAQIQAFMGYVNCNVNGSRYVGMLVMANQALESGNAARSRAGVVVPDQVSQEAGFQDPGLVARCSEDVRHSPSFVLINGGKTYNSEVKVADAEETLPPFTIVRNA